MFIYVILSFLKTESICHTNGTGGLVYFYLENKIWAEYLVLHFKGFSELINILNEFWLGTKFPADLKCPCACVLFCSMHLC